MNRRRNLRDEEARVIGVQDDAAQEMRRVKARRPHDAAERRDKKSQESRVGSRERNARDEMTRLRGEAVGMGLKGGGRAVKKRLGRGNAKAAAAERRANATQLGAGIQRAPSAGGWSKGGKTVKKNMGGAISASLKNMEGDIDKALKNIPSEEDIAFEVPMVGDYGDNPYGRKRGYIPRHPGNALGSKNSPSGARKSIYKTGGKVVKKMATGRQTKADRQDESLGMRDGKESTKTQSYKSRRDESNAMSRGSTPRARTNTPSTKRQNNMLINQHKRMAMGENVLLAKGGRAPSTTAVNIDMGAPKTKTIKARGMGAATRGGNFRENT